MTAALAHSATTTGFGADTFVQLLLPVVGVILLGALLPFAASLVLDGIVLAVRGRGSKGIAIAVVLTTATAVAGEAALQLGGRSASMDASFTVLLPYSCTLAAVAFVIRQLRSLTGAVSRRSTATPASHRDNRSRSAPGSVTRG